MALWLKSLFRSEIHRLEFPLWFSGLRTWHSAHEDVSLIPGPSVLKIWHCCKLPADVAQIWRCCGCSTGQQLLAQIQFLVQELPYVAGEAIKRKRKKVHEFITVLENGLNSALLAQVQAFIFYQAKKQNGRKKKWVNE